LPPHHLHVEPIVLPRVVPTPAPGGSGDDAQHVWIVVGRPEREAIEAEKHQDAGPERVEEVEGGSAHQERQEEQAAVDAADRERSVERFVYRAVGWLVWHDALLSF